jgi:AraC family transcriptional regulator
MQRTERVTEAGAVFESDHRGCSAMEHHRHVTPFVTIVLSGAYVEVRDAVPEVCRSGAIVVHQAAEEHADRFATDTRCLNVELPRDGRAPSLLGAVVLDTEAIRAVKSLIEAFYGRTDGLEEAVKNLQATVIEQLFEPPRERPDWLRRVIDEFPWADSVPLRDAAAMAGVHETHFSREFRRHVGMTANEYRARARLKVASQLLLTTTSKLSRIALNAGFSDQSHFTRLFSERLGLPPAAYRRIFAR